MKIEGIDRRSWAATFRQGKFKCSRRHQTEEAVSSQTCYLKTQSQEKGKGKWMKRMKNTRGKIEMTLKEWRVESSPKASRDWSKHTGCPDCLTMDISGATSDSTREGWDSHLRQNEGESQTQWSPPVINTQGPEQEEWYKVGGQVTQQDSIN